jgi:hypothetical protein
MTKPVTYLYTFIDNETGELADILAPNESAARLWLAGDWILPGRCPLFAPPANVGGWDKVIKDAQAEAAEAFEAMNAARPRPGRTTPEALRAHADASVRHRCKRDRVTKLINMTVNAA